MRPAIVALALVFSLSATTLSMTAPVWAGQKQLVSDEKNPEEVLGEGAALIFQALKMMIDNIPQYHAPQVMENGDIIIRRVQPDEKPDGNNEPAPAADSQKDQTKT